MSRLRQKWTRNDIRNATILRFAREYHGEKFKFLTLTSKVEESSSLRDRKRRLFRCLRVEYPGLEYRCTRTDEGNGVCHICLVSSRYIPWQVIEKHWAARVNISQEKSLEKLLFEMSLQEEHACYSMSRSFLPEGSLDAIEALSRHFRGRLNRKALVMLGRRWKHDNGLSSLHKTLTCCERKDGWCSDIRTRAEYLGGRNVTL